MRQPPSDPGVPASADALLSDEVITPLTPPDPKDAFRLFVDGASEYAVLALSPTGLVCSWNRGAERINGYRPDEIIGQHFSIFYPESDRVAGLPEKTLERALAEGGVVTEGWRIRKDGTGFWASVILTPLRDDVGRLRGFGKLTRDETDRRDSEARAVRYEEQERIAVSLADTVVRRLFTMSLYADAAMRLTPNPEAHRRLQLLVEEAEEAIRYLRNAVFELRSPSERLEPG